MNELEEAKALLETLKHIPVLDNRAIEYIERRANTIPGAITLFRNLLFLAKEHIVTVPREELEYVLEAVGKLSDVNDSVLVYPVEDMARIRLAAGRIWTLLESKPNG